MHYKSDYQAKMVSTTEAGMDYLTITNGRLTINNPTRDRDTAPFWCEAFNEFGRIISEQGRIDFISKCSLITPLYQCPALHRETNHNLASCVFIVSLNTITRIWKTIIFEMI